MNVLCTGHVPRAVGRGGSGVLNTPPLRFFQPYYRNAPPPAFSKVCLQPWGPPPSLFF